MIFGDGLLLFLGTALWVWSAVDCFFTEPARVRSLQKTWWVLIVLLFWAFGALAWIGFGRPKKAPATVPRVNRAATNGPDRRRARPVAPDDDPEFLLRLRDELKRNKPDQPD